MLCALTLLGATPVSESTQLQAVATTAAAHARATLGARFGIAIWDVRTGARASVHGAEGFPLASTFKAPLAMTVFEAIDAGKLRADRQLVVLPRDVVTFASSVADEYAKGKRTFTVDDLLTRMLRDSDNTAADTLYRVIGGAPAVNAALTRAGFSGIRIRTDEAGLGRDFAAGRDYAHGGDNSGTPNGYAKLLRTLLVFEDPRVGPLAPSSADEFFDIASASQTGTGRLRAGLPPHTRLAHKTGTSARSKNGAVDAINDAGVAFLVAGRRPVVIVAFLNGGRGTAAQNDASLASLARAVAGVVR